MARQLNEHARILIASDQRGEAEGLRKLIDQDYASVALSFEPDQAIEDFEKVLPDLILLAFGKIELAQRYYLGLYRFSNVAQGHPHRTIVLCSKEELRKAYELCCKRYFDDYVLFWPSPFDGYRLPMSMHVALRDLKDGGLRGPSPVQLAKHAEQLGELERMLDERLADGGREVAQAADHIEHQSNQLTSALDQMLEDMRRELDNSALHPAGTKMLERLMSKLTVEQIRPLIASGRLAVEPLRRWIMDLQRESGTHLEQTRELIKLIRDIPQRILIVDDDDFSQKLVSRLLLREGYEPICASTAGEAITLIRKARPALILMDYMLPDEDGLSATKRIKSVEAFADIPVIMLTGQRDRETVVNSLLVGASDFVGKPVNAVTLMAKITRYLGGSQGA
ncbi:response regulator [Rhodanobacter umsongensis]